MTAPVKRSDSASPLAELLDQALYASGGLGTVTQPVLDTLLVQRQSLCLTRSDRIKKTDALDATPIPTGTAIGNHDMIERALLGAATRQTTESPKKRQIIFHSKKPVKR
jgi:hypothetical protein